MVKTTRFFVKELASWELDVKDKGSFIQDDDQMDRLSGDESGENLEDNCNISKIKGKIFIFYYIQNTRIIFSEHRKTF